MKDPTLIDPALFQQIVVHLVATLPDVKAFQASIRDQWLPYETDSAELEGKEAALANYELLVSWAAERVHKSQQQRRR